MNNPVDQGNWWQSAATEQPSPSKKQVDKVAFDSVPVAEWFFTDAIFCGSEIKREFVRGGQPGDEKPQKMRDGLPVWTVELTVRSSEQDGGKQRRGSIKVSVPMKEDPSTVFAFGQPVTIGGLNFGVVAINRGSNRDHVLWWSADELRPAAQLAAAKAS